MVLESDFKLINTPFISVLKNLMTMTLNSNVNEIIKLGQNLRALL
jgi:hypothetical protein